MTPEGRLKKDVKMILRKYKPLWHFMPVMGQGGVSGIPDFIICANGRFLTVETKTEKAQLTPLQLATDNKLKAAQAIALVIRPSNLHELETYLLFLGCHADTP